MSSLKWLNILLYIGNFLGIHRRYSSQKKIKKHFIIFQIFVQTLLYTILAIYRAYLVSGSEGYNQMKFIFFCFGTTLYFDCVSTIMTNICYSRDFMSYLDSISRASEFLKNEKKLFNTLKKIFLFVMPLILLSFLYSVHRSTVGFMVYGPSDPLVILVSLVLLQALTRITVVFQHLVLYVVIMIVVNLTNGLTTLISLAQERVGRCGLSSDEHDGVTREQIQEWVELYRDLVNCCEKVTLCFGRQYFFSLFISTSQNIMVWYEVFYKCILNAGSVYDTMRLSLALITYSSVMMMPLIAGQMATNQGVKLHRVLVRLYNTMIVDSGEAEAKLIRDFIRLLKKNALEIKLSTKVPAGLYILPVVLMLAVNYVIVMLQFNHAI